MAYVQPDRVLLERAIMPRRRLQPLNLDIGALVAVAQTDHFDLAELYVGVLRKRGVFSMIATPESEMTHFGYHVKVQTEDYEKAYQIIRSSQGAAHDLAFLLEDEDQRLNHRDFNLFIDPDHAA